MVGLQREPEDGAQQFATLGDFKLQSGTVVHDFRIGYRIVGNMNADKSNVILWPTMLGGRTEDLLQYSRGEEWTDFSSQAKTELSLRLETQRELEGTKRQLEETKQQLADERGNKLSVDEIVLREAREGFRGMMVLRDLTVPPRERLNEAWVQMVAGKHGKTVKEIALASV